MKGNEANANDTYGVLSKGLQQANQSGKLKRASETLRLMAIVLEDEREFTDKGKKGKLEEVLLNLEK